jgi:hypothetical protein
MSGRARPRGPWYRELVLVSGLALIALGIGNWATGTVRLREYAEEAERLTAAAAAAGDPEAVPAELELARARMDFYHVVASGGRLMSAAGIIVTAFALARTLRGEARRSSKRQRSDPTHP